MNAPFPAVRSLRSAPLVGARVIAIDPRAARQQVVQAMQSLGGMAQYLRRAASGSVSITLDPSVPPGVKEAVFRLWQGQPVHMRAGVVTIEVTPPSGQRAEGMDLGASRRRAPVRTRGRHAAPVAHGRGGARGRRGAPVRGRGRGRHPVRGFVPVQPEATTPLTTQPDGTLVLTPNALRLYQQTMRATQQAGQHPCPPGQAWSDRREMCVAAPQRPVPPPPPFVPRPPPNTPAPGGYGSGSGGQGIPPPSPYQPTGGNAPTGGGGGGGGDTGYQPQPAASFSDEDTDEESDEFDETNEGTGLYDDDETSDELSDGFSLGIRG